MTPGILAVKSIGLSTVHRPPRGTSSRILRIRLRRCESSFHQPSSRRTRNEAAICTFVNPTTRLRSGRLADQTPSTCRSVTTSDYTALTPDETGFLSELVARFGSAAKSEIWTEHTKGICNQGDDDQPQHLAGSGLGGVEACHVGEDLTLELPNPFKRALQAIQQRDSRQLLIYLKQIVAMPYEDIVTSVGALPKTTFSEFLQSLDPCEVGPENDPTDGTHISVGMWQVLDLHNVVDEWGIRYIYVRLLERMLILVHALRTAGRLLGASDYIPLIRAAGAVSDISSVKTFWDDAQSNKATSRLPSEMRNEFVKARMLIHPLYSSYDKTRTLVKPLDIHRTGRSRYSPRKLYELNQLRLRLRQKAYRFGLNRNKATVEDLSRIHRKRGPITRIFVAFQRNGHPITEDFLCSAIVAFGRASALRFIQVRILEDFFGIFARKTKRDVTVDRRKHTLVRYCIMSAEVKKERPRDPLRPLHPFVKPTERLMYAIIEAYCSNGQFEYATQLVNFISKQFDIPIPAEAWFELLRWAYICRESPNAVAWRKAGMFDRVSSKDSVQIIWNIMTSPPYNIKPQFEHYNYLIRSLICRKQYVQALRHITTAKELYTKQLAEYETTVFAYVHALRSGISPTDTFRVYQRARYRKQRMWFLMSGWFRLFLTKKFRSGRMEDEWVTRLIPDIVKGYRDIMPNPVEYRTATGYVQLVDPAEDWPFKMNIGDDVVTEIPMRASAGQQRLERIRKTRWTWLSSHSLAEKENTMLDPLILLTDRWTSFRAAHHRAAFTWAKARKRERLARQGIKPDISQADDTDD